MTLRTHVPTALVLLGVAALVVPALVPVQPKLYHDTRAGVTGNATEIEQQGHEIVAYEDLSDRGQELYRRALRADGEYGVPVGEGASAFPYPTATELAETEDFRERNAMTAIAIERPPDADLPPADEPLDRAEHRPIQREGPEGVTDGEAERTPRETASVEDRRRQIARYDLVRTHTGRPEFTALPNLLRFLSVAVGAVAIASGGYLRSLP